MLTPKLEAALTCGVVLAATMAVSDCVVTPPGPEQASVKFVELVKLLTILLPTGGTEPDHPPVALQAVAPMDFQISVAEPLYGTTDGDEVSVTVGGVAAKASNRFNRVIAPTMILKREGDIVFILINLE